MSRASLLLSILFFLSSCANYKLNVSKDITNPIPELPTDLELVHTMYLIGDAGNSKMGQISPALKFFGEQLKEASKNSSVIYLGDNIYPGGFPKKKDPGRALAEHRVNVQLDVLKDYKGKAYIMPGNHDWRSGLKRLNKLEKYIEEYDDVKIKWLPDDGCSGPEIVEINDNLVVIFVDSQWWLMNWDKEPELNSGCENKSKQNFLYFFEEAMKKHRRKNVVIAMHHPLYSNGPHGGRFTTRQHLFPLTQANPNLYIPLPGIGTAMSFLRGTIGSRQDIAHPELKALRRGLQASANKNGSFIFVAGHEHNLQLFEKGKQAYVISGAGSKKSPAGKGNDASMTYGHQGHSLMKFYEDGSVWIEFWVPTGDGSKGELVFRKRIKDKLSALDIEPPTSFPEYESGQKTFTIKLDEEPQKSKSHRWWWGEHYREAYRAEVTAPVLDLETFQGGMEAVKRGGGYQTNSIRLKDPNGRQWVMRDMLKDATRIVPYPFNKTFAKDIFADQFTSAHPYAAFVIPDMAKSVNIYHTNPKLYYVPKQPRLGLYNEGFGGGFYLIEERAGGNWENLESFGNPEDLISTIELSQKLQKNHKHKIDQTWTLRTRLFDQVIGDWDRHDDQFRWNPMEQEDGTKLYRPIPRDRDQPFSTYDGVIPAILRSTVPFMKQLKVFTPEIPKIQWVNYHSRYFDPAFIHEMTREDFRREAKFIQENLTDEVIENAIKQWPEPIYELNGEKITEIVKARRDGLQKIANDLYEMVAEKIVIVGTEKSEYFEIDRMNDMETSVTMYASNKKGEKKEVLYNRVFRMDETEEIRLYGLANEDHFYLKGEVNEGILIRCIGGVDEDTFVDESKVGGAGKKTMIYDSKEENNLTLGTEAKDKTSNNPVKNTYDRRSKDFEYNYAMPLPVIAFNPDDGLLLGAAIKYFDYGFQKDPYASTHLFALDYALATEGINLKYNGEFIQALGKWDVTLDAKFSSPRYTRNFFGLGNETVNLNDDDLDFNRVQQRVYGLYSGLRKRIGKQSYFKVQGELESVSIDDLTERFANSGNPDTRPANFDAVGFAGAEIEFNYENSDNRNVPTKGLRFNAALGYKANLKETDRDFAYIRSSIGFYAGGKNIVFGSRVGTDHRFSNDFEFFQAATLGGSDNLRGFRDERFAGRTSFYHNSDLRIRLFTAENYYIPFTFGIIGGYDYGRVWVPNEESDKWHSAAGGGIWISPFDAAVINFSLFKSAEDYRFQVRGGFLF